MQDGSPPLLGAHEIRVMLGVSRQRVYELTTRPDFPAPVAELAQGKVWARADIDAWISVYRAGQGRGGAGRRPSSAPVVGRMPDGPLPLVGAHEIRDMLGVSRQRVYQLAMRSDFPEPIVELAQGKVWVRAEIQAWISVYRAGQSGGRAGRHVGQPVPGC